MTTATNKKSKYLLYMLCSFVGLLLVTLVLLSDDWENPLQLFSRHRKTGSRQLIVTAQSMNSTNKMIRQELMFYKLVCNDVINQGSQTQIDWRDTL